MIPLAGGNVARSLVADVLPTYLTDTEGRATTPDLLVSAQIS